MCRILYRESRTEPSEADRKVFEEALEMLKPGGPDEQNIVYREYDNLSTNNKTYVLAGHTRLAIQNLEGGHQPKEEHHSMLLYNGEIYNGPELTDFFALPIEEMGDTDVLAKLMDKSDHAIFYDSPSINEEAAFVLKRYGGQVSAVRGNLGIKPLYYYYDDNELIISSEIKAIVHIMSEDRFIMYNDQSMQLLLSLGFIPGKRTIYSDIYKVPPATAMVFTPHQDGWNVISNSLDPLSRIIPDRKVFSENEPPIEPFQSDKAMRLRQALTESVRRRANISDVPVSLTLSGGVDSAILAYLIKETAKEIPSIYTLSFKGFENEIDKATRVVQHLGLGDKHKIIEVDFDEFFEKDFNDFLDAIDEPMDKGSMIPTYYLAKNIEEKVTLVGEGADELFGGYNRHEAALGFVENPAFPTNKLIDNFIRQKYLLVQEFYKDDHELYPLIKAEFAQSLITTDLNAVLRFDQRHELPEYHNMRLDKMMAHFGKEVRLPYEDEAVLKVARTIPNHISHHYTQENSIRKQYLRRAFEDVLPYWYLSPPKQALKIPYDDVVEHPFVKDYLLTKEFPTTDAILQDYGIELNVEEIYKDTTRRNRGRFLWLLFLTFKWMDRKIEKINE